MALAAGSVDFNGSTSKAEHTTANMPNGTTQITVCAWARADGFGEGSLGRIFSIPHAAGAELAIRHHFSDANKLQWFARFSGAQAQWEFAAPDGQWNAIAISYDWSLTTNDPVVRVNFQSVTATETTAPSGSIAPGAGYCVGNVTSQNATWDGQIAHFQVFNALLSAEQMDKALRAPGSVTSNLRVYIRLTNSTDLADQTLNDFDAIGTELATGATGPGLGAPLLRQLLLEAK